MAAVASAKFYQCSICCQLYKEPKILKCGHSFCGKCIADLPDVSRIVCPQCDTETVVPKSGLPTNNALQHMIADIQCLLEEGSSDKINDSYHVKAIAIAKQHHQNQQELMEKYQTVCESLDEFISKSDNMAMDQTWYEKTLDDMRDISITVQVASTRMIQVLDNIEHKIIRWNKELKTSKISSSGGPKQTTSRSLKSSVVLIGGFGNGNTMESYHPGNPYYNQPLNYPLHSSRCYNVSAFINNQLYVVGGYDNMRSTEIIDPLENKWIGHGPDMRIERNFFAGAAVLDRFMIFGGRGQSSCETLNPVINVWSLLPDMKHERHSHGAVELNGQVYIIGGWTSEVVSKLVSTFDLKSGKWSSGTAMNQRRAQLAAARLGSCIVATGGYGTDVDSLNTCETLDPRENRWRRIASLWQKRHSHCLVNYYGRLLAIGGRNAESNVKNDKTKMVDLSSVEEYDHRMDKWFMAEPLKTKRAAFSAVHIP